MSIIGAIIIGFLAGLIARAILPGKQGMGFILTTVLGIVGALVATYAGRAMGWYQEGAAAGFIASVVGAIIVLLIYGAVAGRAR
ncbi:MAG: GlsB/YeaQ/YmgE family stress response membrane protein [Comamonadaceae bacterium]|nr:MAG: GlsB/YeaQ/YmgE family stress response membrane protein [Comamonadaceae bacterium]